MPVGLALLLLPAAGARAQAPGLPVLQSPFVAPGIVAALDGARGGGRSAFAGAVSWAPGSARLQGTVGAGTFDAGSAYRSPGTILGGRLAVPVLTRPRLGVVAFAGAGTLRLLQRETRAVPPADSALPRLDARVLQVPVGVSVGTRGAWGGGRRAWSVAAVPSWRYSRTSGGGLAEPAAGSALRVAALAEVALSPRFGVQLGVEGGGTGDDPGIGVAAAGTVIGLGVGIAFGRAPGR